jgi:predicted dehydrogenase
MLDMGPYYLTALATLIGPVRRATGSARITFPERPLGAPTFKVNTPTHVVGVLDHTSGAVSTIITSTDVWPTELPRIEIYGVTGTLSVPDPNNFGGSVRLRRANEREWTEVPLTRGYAENSRGLGVADMARAIRTGRPHRASGELAYHVLDVMHAIHEASREDRHVRVTSDFARPAPLPAGLEEGELD